MHLDEELPDVHPTVTASNQIADAIIDLERHPDRAMRWPWPDMDAMTGPLNTGEVWFVCAISSGGKTTFVASAIDAWQSAGKKVYVMPLELRPKTFRTVLACMAVGVHPGDALSLNLLSQPNGLAQREAVKGALNGQIRSPFVDRVMVSEQKAINVHGLEQGLKEAKAFGADVVIVDHIDHIAGGDGSNLFAESKAVNHAALRMAQDNELLLVFTSQLNLAISRNPDHLAKYAPPRVDHVFLPSIKLQIATGMVGLFRKIRDRRETESPEEYLECLKKGRRGELEAPDVLDKGIMGVNAMKLRHYGQREGTRVFLGLERGRVVGLNDRDRYRTGTI